MSEAGGATAERSGTGPTSEPDGFRVRRVALLGNPNTGKTTLFNELTGVRHRTANFPGTTQECVVGRGVTATAASGEAVELYDLPGVYSLEIGQPESVVCREVLQGEASLPAGPGEASGAGTGELDALVVVVDATNLARNLTLVGEALRRRLPTVVMLTMADRAERLGLRVDRERLASELGCAVVVRERRRGVDAAKLGAALAEARVGTRTPPGDETGLTAWAEAVYRSVATADRDEPDSTLTDRLDRVFTHPVLGLGVFAVAMTGLFWLLFRLATVPMDLIDGVFSNLAAWVEGSMPAGLMADLLANGVIAGVGATVIFLPQILLLFFVISLLEDTGYLARAAFVMDRALRPFGLPGYAFVPLLSSHACALPGIMAARAIPDRRERLATILSAPFMTCSARLPVYALLVVVLFPGRPGLQAAAFVGCYALGVVAGLLSALVARRTILRGKARPMALELPDYRRPSLRTAIGVTWDRGLIFLKKAGTLILAISIVLWWLGTYPQTEGSPAGDELRERAALVAESDPRAAAELEDEASVADDRFAASNTFMARIGKAVQPVFAPMGWDWQTSVGVMASFAAREVFVSTMAVVTSGSGEEDEGVLESLATAERRGGADEGEPVFTARASWALLVYYVLAMQCLPTLAVTAKESGHTKWAALQLVWMLGVAYAAALATSALAGVLG